MTRDEWDAMVGVPTTEEDDVKPLYIQKKSDPNLGIWVTDGIFKRHVGPDEWGFVLFVSKPAPGVVPISDQWWDTLPDAAKA